MSILARMVPAVTLIIFLAGEPVAQDTPLPPAEGVAVLTYITHVDPYTTWPLWPGSAPLYHGREPHGTLLTTYVNPPAYQALQQKRDLPDGSIIVKENYTPARRLETVTVMYRKAGYNPAVGNYFWLEYTPEGQILAEGQVHLCVGCHTMADGEDYLYTNDYRQR